MNNGSILSFSFISFLSSIFLVIIMNRRQIRLLGLYTPIVFRLCILKVIESKFGDPESFLEVRLLMMILQGSMIG